MKDPDAPTADELTEAMHSEFFVDEETKKMHTVWMYLEGQSWDTSDMSSYGLTQADIDKYRPSYEALSDDDD